MSTRLEDLTFPTQQAAKLALADLDARDIPVVVTYTLRTTAEQAALYAQGRESLITVNTLRASAGLPAIGEADNRDKVTNCNGVRIAEGGTGQSPHQLGTALDVVPKGPNGNPIWPDNSDPRWTDIAYSFEQNGFEWGGRWTDFPDFPHYQLKETT